MTPALDPSLCSPGEAAMTRLSLAEIADLHRAGQPHAIADGEPADPRAWLVAEANDFRLSAALCGLGDHPEWVDAAIADVAVAPHEGLPWIIRHIEQAACGKLGAPKTVSSRIVIANMAPLRHETGIVRLTLWLCAGYLSLDPARPPRGEGYPVRDLALLAANLWALVAEDGLEDLP